jgi:hypothetical protein
MVSISEAAIARSTESRRSVPRAGQDRSPAWIMGLVTTPGYRSVAAAVEMTIVDIEFADQLILVGVGNADAEMSRHTGMGGGRGHRRAPCAEFRSGKARSLALSI